MIKFLICFVVMTIIVSIIVFFESLLAKKDKERESLKQEYEKKIKLKCEVIKEYEQILNDAKRLSSTIVQVPGKVITLKSTRVIDMNEHNRYSKHEEEFLGAIKKQLTEDLISKIVSDDFIDFDVSRNIMNHEDAIIASLHVVKR